MKNVSKIVLGLAIAAGAVSAQAAESGFFAEGGIGTNTNAVYNNKQFYIHSKALALIANGGYEFNQYIAAEGGYSLHHDGDAEPTSTHDLHVAARGSLPLGDKFKLIGKLGAGLVMQEGVDSRFGTFFGAGGAYALNDSTDITVQYQGIHLSKKDLYPAHTTGSVTAGVTYHFS